MRGLKALLVAMASARLPPTSGRDRWPAGGLVARGQFTLERTYRGRGLLGRRYVLQNVSGTLWVLTSPSSTGRTTSPARVAGIAIEHHNLRRVGVPRSS